MKLSLQKIEVETAAYAILTALKHRDIDYCYEIAIWLHRQRMNANIFRTTQVHTSFSLSKAISIQVNILNNFTSIITVKVGAA